MSTKHWIGMGAGIAVVSALGAWWYFGVSSSGVVSVSRDGSQSVPTETAVQEESVSQPAVVPEDQPSEEEPEKTVDAAPVSAAPETQEDMPVRQPDAKTGTVKETAKQSDTKSTGSKLSVKNRLVSFGFSVSSGIRSVDTIVVHSSYNALGGDVFDTDKVIQEYEEAGVSPHYVVARGGTVYRLVKENDTAWHAGTSKMSDGRTNVNGFSIGIEMIGTLESGYTDDQYVALNALIKDIKERYAIKHIVGHDDIAPGRKTDPWKLEWSRVKK